MPHLSTELPHKSSTLSSFLICFLLILIFLILSFKTFKSASLHLTQLNFFCDETQPNRSNVQNKMRLKCLAGEDEKKRFKAFKAERQAARSHLLERAKIVRQNQMF